WEALGAGCGRRGRGVRQERGGRRSSRRPRTSAVGGGGAQERGRRRRPAPHPRAPEAPCGASAVAGSLPWSWRTYRPCLPSRRRVVAFSRRYATAASLSRPAEGPRRAAGPRRWERRPATFAPGVAKEAGIESKLARDLESGLHLHHHLGPRRERAMFASLGFVVALAITRGVTTFLHYRGAGPNGGIVVRGVHIHHLVFGIV